MQNKHKCNTIIKLITWVHSGKSKKADSPCPGHGAGSPGIPGIPGAGSRHGPGRTGRSTWGRAPT